MFNFQQNYIFYKVFGPKKVVIEIIICMYLVVVMWAQN